MYQITGFTRAEHTMLSRAMVGELQELAERYGIEISAAGGKYGNGGFEIKLDVKSADDKMVADAERRDFEANCWAAGLKPEHYGTVIKVQGQDMRVYAVSPRASKYPIKVKPVYGSGRGYKLPSYYASDIIAAYVKGRQP